MNDEDLIFFTIFFFILWLMSIPRIWQRDSRLETRAVKIAELQMRVADLDSEVCGLKGAIREHNRMVTAYQIGRASCRERV